MTPGNSLYFPAVDFIKQSVGHAGVKQGSSQIPVVVDCRYVLGADFTAAKVSLIYLFYNKINLTNSEFILLKLLFNL